MSTMGQRASCMGEFPHAPTAKEILSFGHFFGHFHVRIGGHLAGLPGMRLAG
jgi:hypothetical protein